MRNLRREATAAWQIRTLLSDGGAGHLADGVLLERFATSRGDAAEAAFSALVERHGPMVLRACRSILRDPHEAQDAFQSTFLLLARRARSLWVRDSLAPWLHSVACRISSGVRAAEGRRRSLERKVASRISRLAHDLPRDELASALHEEIERLPERLKAPLVLCYLQGLTHERAADHLSCPVGTVRSRLSRARERLRRSLARRGFTPSTTSESATPSILPPSMAGLAIQGARLVSARAAVGPIARWLIILSEGVLKLMSIHPLKTVAALVLASGAVVVGLGTTSGQEPKPPEKASLLASETPPRDQSAIDKRFEALEARIRELETRLEEVAPSRRMLPRAVDHSIGPLNKYDPDTLIKIRPRFDNALVEKVFVTTGQTVKKGEPLMELRSAEVGLAKNECRTNFVQWDHDRKYLDAREPLAKDGRITHLVWTETQNDEKKSRLSYLVSREKLATYGMTYEQIDQLLEGLSDDAKQRLEILNNAKDITRMTVVSPIDGIVVQRDAAPGNFYDQKDILFLITPPKP